MGLGQTGPEISSPAHLLGHSWSYGGLESGLIENILGQIDYIYPNRLCLIFMKLDQAGPDIFSLAHFCGHSWSYAGPGGPSIENIPFQIGSIRPNMHYVRFSRS